MKRAIAIALAALCAAPAALGSWHCSALNRNYAYPDTQWGSLEPYDPPTNVTMSSKEAVVAIGSGLEWITNVAVFAHGRNPANYAKLVSHTLNTNLLPRAYLEWMYNQARTIFTRDWHGTYEDGSNTIQVLGLQYGDPWSVAYEGSGYDISAVDIRHCFSSVALDFNPEDGDGALVGAYSNSIKRILGREPSIDKYGTFLDYEIGCDYYPLQWGLINPGGYDSPYMQYLLSGAFPTCFITTPFQALNLAWKYGGVSPFSVESATSRKTNRTTYEITITTNADQTATMKVKFIRHETPKHTNYTHTVERVALGSTASAESTAYGEPESIEVSSMYKIFLYGQPIYHTFDILGVSTPCVCYGVGGSWGENQQFTNSIAYNFDYTTSRILADYPFMRSTYPPFIPDSNNYTDAAVIYKAVANGHSYDYGYSYVDETAASGAGAVNASSPSSSDAMKAACDAAMTATNEFSSVTYDMWGHLHNNLPNVEYDEDIEDITIYPEIILHDGKTAFLMFREEDGALMGVCNTNNWEWSPEYPNPYHKSFEYRPYYHDSNYMQLYDEYYTSGEEWRMTLDLDFDAYGYWYFNNWHR